MSRHFTSNYRNQRSNSRKLALFSSCFLFAGLIACTFFIVTKGDTTLPVFVENDTNNDVVQVLIPQGKILNGQKLDASMFSLERRPKSLVSAGYISDSNAILNKYAATIILAGQPVYYEHLSATAPGALGDKIPEGYRAVAIRVNDISSVEGFATAGSMVDVHWLGTHNNRAMIVNIVQKCKVLSAERNINPTTAETAIVPGTVTLLAKSDEAKKITLAQANGSLVLHLRNPNDPEVVSSEPVILTGLFGAEPSTIVTKRAYTGKITVGGIDYCIEGSRMFQETEENSCPM